MLSVTCRRRNRKPLNRTMSTVEMEPEKLSQEAFRLLRTANNLLNTHEPSLMIPKSIFDSTYSSHLMSQSLNSSFCRKSEDRQSGTSMRSCCDTNSTSSNSSGASSASPSQKAPLVIDTDMDDVQEEATKTGKPEPGKRNSNPAMLLHSEAESGFSSISSFQEIGLPLLNSTKCRSNSGACFSSNASNNSDDSTNEFDLTLQAAVKEGVPPTLPKRMHYNHRRWDSAPALPPKKPSTSPYHAFQTPENGEESLRVLWV